MKYTEVCVRGTSKSKLNIFTCMYKRYSWRWLGDVISVGSINVGVVIVGINWRWLRQRWLYWCWRYRRTRYQRKPHFRAVFCVIAVGIIAVGFIGVGFSNIGWVDVGDIVAADTNLSVIYVPSSELLALASSVFGFFNIDFGFIAVIGVGFIDITIIDLANNRIWYSAIFFNLIADGIH